MIIFLYGEDGFRARRKLNELKEKFLREVDPSGNALAIVNGEKAEIKEISGSIGASSLLAEKRMIAVEGLFLNKSRTVFNQAKEYLSKQGVSGNIIIFLDSVSGKDRQPKYKSELFKFLSKQKYAQEFKTLSNAEAAAWAKKEVESRGGKISVSAATELISLLGNDLWQVNSEINKLISYKAGQKLRLGDNEKGTEINIEDIKSLVRGQFDENIFALTDAISNKNKSAAVKLFEEQIEAGLTDGYLLNMIIRQFKILMQIRQALDSGLNSRKIINLLKLHPFIVQKGIGQARNFNLSVLKNIFNKLIEIDYEMKSGKADVKPALSLLIARI